MCKNKKLKKVKKCMEIKEMNLQVRLHVRKDV